MNKRTLGITLSLALGAVTLAGCGLGSAEDGGGGGGFTPTPLDKETCHTDLEITGVMTPAPKPPDYDPELGDTNCWPAGEWKFTARAKATNEDPKKVQCTGTTLLPEYKITVTKANDVDALETYVFTTNPSAKTRLKVSSGGGGLCEGVFEIYSDDGKTLQNLHPALLPANGAATHVLSGHGEYQVFENDQWIPPS